MENNRDSLPECRAYTQVYNKKQEGIDTTVQWYDVNWYERPFFKKYISYITRFSIKLNW